MMMMTKARVLAGLTALACALFTPVAAARANVPAMPFAKGTVWVYEGKVAWHDGTEVKSKRIRLETEIVETFQHPLARVALVRGFPSELTWYGDKEHPRYSLLVLTREALDELEMDSQQEARRLARDFSALSSELRRRTYTLITFPLKGGSRFRSAVRGVRPSRGLMRYRSQYVTNPDHTIVDFVPGLGVVRYIYEHHGTVSSVDVKLTEILYRGRGRKRRRGWTTRVLT